MGRGAVDAAQAVVGAGAVVGGGAVVAAAGVINEDEFGGEGGAECKSVAMVDRQQFEVENVKS